MQEQEEAGLPGQGLVIRHIISGYGQRSYPGCRSQPKGHVPTIKERTFPDMGEGDDDIVHSGGLPTTTVLEGQGWQGIVTLSYLECSLCHVF
jgi:hypothetical protein